MPSQPLYPHVPAKKEPLFPHVPGGHSRINPQTATLPAEWMEHILEPSLLPQTAEKEKGWKDFYKGNRVQASIDSVNWRIQNRKVTKEALDKLNESLKTSWQDLGEYQKLQAWAFASGLLTKEEAQQLYELYGGENPTPEKWDKHTIAEKVAATRMASELLDLRAKRGGPVTKLPATRYEFFPEGLKKKLPPLLYGGEQKDPMVYAKFFTPWTNWTWYAMEFDGEDTFFGWVVGLEKEFGSFSLSELQSIRGPGGLKIERDIYFEPKPISQVMKECGAKWYQPMTIPKSTDHRVFRVSDGKLMFAGNAKDALREFKRLGGTKAGYRFMLSMSETMPPQALVLPATSGTEVYVQKLPKCDFCGKPALYDAKTTMGPWAHMCEEHYLRHGIGLGTGKGQKLIPRKALGEAEKIRGEPPKELAVRMTEADLEAATLEDMWYPVCPYCGASTPAEPDAQAIYCQACSRRFKIVNPFF